MNPESWKKSVFPAIIGRYVWAVALTALFFMNELTKGIIVVLLVSAFFVIVFLLCYAGEKQDRKQLNISETAKDQQLNRLLLGDVERRISERITQVFPGAGWRWITDPMAVVLRGGWTRIALTSAGSYNYADIGLFENSGVSVNFLRVDDLNRVDRTAENAQAVQAKTATEKTTCSFGIAEENTVNDIIVVMPSEATKPGSDPAGTQTLLLPILPEQVEIADAESIEKWYNVSFSDRLKETITDLNAAGRFCLYIAQDGTACAGDEQEKAGELGEMPNISLWDDVIERIIEEGLTAEIRGDKLFVSWA